ncbi:MAG TPA: glycosyltransferase [Melioribacteraceae bacterium]|nr:glycosyltransferase [Melioribacteraceae bacterium]
MIFFISVLSFIYFIFLIVVIISLKQKKDPYSSNLKEHFISIIIPFKNESLNILNNLNSIRDLDYNKNCFEVIYVNDNSTDDSVLKLKENIIDSNIRILEYKNDNVGGKKRAVKYAIDNCKGDLIFTTDADCIVKKDWLKLTVPLFDVNTAFISGIVKFSDGKSIWSKLQQIEFAGLVLVGGGLINAGFASICNAANLAFKKSVFYEVGGFDDNMHIKSGDDELLMQKIALKTNYTIKYFFNNNTVVTTKSNNSFKEFYYQRVRWASKGLHYKNPLLILFLIIIYLFFLSFPFQLLFGIIFNGYYLLSLSLFFIIKILLEYRILLFGEKTLFNKISLLELLIAEFLHIPYIIIAGFMGTFGKYKWKGSI